MSSSLKCVGRVCSSPARSTAGGWGSPRHWASPLGRARPAPAGPSSYRWAELGRVSAQAGQGCGEMETRHRDWSLRGWNGSWAMTGWGRPLRKCIWDLLDLFGMVSAATSSSPAFMLFSLSSTVHPGWVLLAACRQADVQ